MNPRRAAIRLVDEWFDDTTAMEASGWASGTEHLLLILKAILASVDLNALKKKGYTPLHALADMEKSNKTRCSEERGMSMHGAAKLLEKCGLRSCSKNIAGKTPLHRAARKGQFELVKGLVETGAEVNVKCNGKWSPVACAAARGHTLIVWYLLRHGAMAKDTEALHQAVYAGSSECVRLLLKAGAEPDERDRNGDTPAHVCCKQQEDTDSAKRTGRAKALALLLDSGADAEVRAEEEQTLLHLAAHNGNAECIPLLLESGLQIDDGDVDLNTALHLACYYEHVECVKELIRGGASLDVAVVCGHTPVLYGALVGHVEIVNELLRAGASVDVKNDDSITPLHVAAALGSMDLAYLLVEAGADVNAQAENQESVLMTCMRPAGSKVYLTLERAENEPGAKEAREKVAIFLLKMGAAVDGRIFAFAAEKGFADAIASFFSRQREQHMTAVDRLGAVAEHYSVTADGDDDKFDEVVQVRLVNKSTGGKGRQYTLSIPLVEQLMERVREQEETKNEEEESGARRSCSTRGTLPDLIDPAKRGYKRLKKGEWRRARGQGSNEERVEAELEYDGVNFTEKGFEAVVKYITTGSVEELLTRWSVLGGKRKRSSNGAEGKEGSNGEGKGGRNGESGSSRNGGEGKSNDKGSKSSSGGGGGSSKGGGGSSSSTRGGPRRGPAKLFDQERAMEALQAAVFFGLDGLSREVKALMAEYGFALQEETGGGGGAWAHGQGGASGAHSQCGDGIQGGPEGEGESLRKKARTDP